MTRTPHTYKRRTITLRPPVDDALARRAKRLHGGNISAAISALVEGAEGVTKSAAVSSAQTTSSNST